MEINPFLPELDILFMFDAGTEALRLPSSRGSCPSDLDSLEDHSYPEAMGAKLDGKPVMCGGRS